MPISLNELKDLPLRICKHCKTSMLVTEAARFPLCSLKFTAFCPKCLRWFDCCETKTRAKFKPVRRTEPLPQRTNNPF